MRLPGVPVIVWEGLASLAYIEPHGQIRLPEINHGALKKAILKLASPRFRRKKAEEIANLSLPLWRDYAHTVAHWLDAL